MLATPKAAKTEMALPCDRRGDGWGSENPVEVVEESPVLRGDMGDFEEEEEEEVEEEEVEEEEEE